MNVEDRLHNARGWLNEATVASTPDLADLDRRQRRGRIRRAATLSFAIIVASAAATIGYTLSRDDTITVASGAASQPNTSAGEAPTPERSDGPAYVLTDLPAGWEETSPMPTSAGLDHSSALAGEEFSQVYVRFDTEQDPFSAHSGNLVGTVRVAVGTYDTGLQDLFTGLSTQVTVSGRDFELVETETDQIALVPVDTSERTFVLTARGVEPEVVVAMAESIDPTQVIPRIGDAPDGFTVIYSGPPEFAILSGGIAVSYRNETGEQTVTVTTFNNVAISCFSNAWAYVDTEITRIGGNSGVIAQLAGQPAATGTYRALWNRGHDTLIGISVSGIDRAQLINLAERLTLDDNASGFEAHLELVR